MEAFLQKFLKEKPFFFSIVRPKEASLYQEYKPFKKPILDIGCGDGFFAQVAFGKGIDVGIDVDKASIDEAKQRNIYKECVVYDGRRIPYPDNHFATALCNSTFEHITNLDEVLTEVARVVKKGGMLYFSIPTDIWGNYLFGNHIFGNAYKKYFIAKSKHYNLYSLSTWEGILKKKGFIIVKNSFYLDNKKILWLFDITHYVSIPSLLVKKLFSRWVLFPEKEKYLKPLEDFLLSQTKQDTAKGPYLFIAAKRI